MICLRRKTPQNARKPGPKTVNVDASKVIRIAYKHSELKTACMCTTEAQTYAHCHGQKIAYWRCVISKGIEDPNSSRAAATSCQLTDADGLQNTPSREGSELQRYKEIAYACPTPDFPPDPLSLLNIFVNPNCVGDRYPRRLSDTCHEQQLLIQLTARR